MKRHGRHKKRFGQNQQARFFAQGLASETTRNDMRQKKVIASQSSDRREMLRGWLRIMSKADARARVVVIYGEDFAASLDFLN